MMKRSTKFWIGFAIVVVVIGSVAMYAASRRSSAPTYDLVTASRRDVIREVSVTGRVKSATEVALAFDVAGRIARVPTAVSAKVAVGAELVALDAASLRAEQQQQRASLAQARAELAELQAGTRPEEVRVAEADVESARRVLVDAERALRETETKAAVDLRGRYRAVVNTLRDAYAKADDAVRKQTDDLFTNDAASPKLTYQTSEYQAAIDAERGRSAMEALLAAWGSELDALADDPIVRDQALVEASARLLEVSMFLDRVLTTLNGATNVSQATIATYKTSVSTGRTNVNTARTAVEELRQAIAAQSATNDGAVTSARAGVTSARNALVGSEAKLALARAGATAEQLEAARARVAAAAATAESGEAQLAKTVLRAPFAGIVTVQDARVGAAVSPGVVIVRLMADAGFEIEAYLPEVDLPGIVTGSGATVTLDAYGSTTEFLASVIAIDPAATFMDGVPTYRTTLALRTIDDRIRAGMTANVTIVAGKREGVVAIPQRAVVTRGGTTIVRVLRDGEVIEVPVQVGLRGSDGYIEITEGLEEGASVIRSERDRR